MPGGSQAGRPRRARTGPRGAHEGRNKHGEVCHCDNETAGVHETRTRAGCVRDDDGKQRQCLVATCPNYRPPARSDSESRRSLRSLSSSGSSILTGYPSFMRLRKHSFPSIPLVSHVSSPVYRHLSSAHWKTRTNYIWA